jgi:hypothetical protein
MKTNQDVASDVYHKHANYQLEIISTFWQLTIKVRRT